MRLAACTLLALIASAVSAGATSTHVSIRSTFPLTVSGAGFDRSAPVTVTAVNGTHKFAKRLRTTARGTFRATWSASVHIASCQPLTVTAVSAHHRAVTEQQAAQDCGVLIGP